MRFYGHTDAISSADISPDGRTLVTISADDTLRLWDIASGRETRQIHYWDFSNREVVRFTPDGQFIVFTALKTIFMIHRNYQDLLTYACTSGYVMRDFTLGERQHYQIKDDTRVCPDFTEGGESVRGVPLVTTTPIPSSTPPFLHLDPDFLAPTSVITPSPNRLA